MNFPFAFIEGIGGPELMLILFIILLLFGANKLPELAKGLGKSVKEFKKAAADVEYQFKEAMEEKSEQSAEAKRFAPKPVTPLAPPQNVAPATPPASTAPGAAQPPPDQPKA
ncbi:MAG: twin-arginine translocase TatA/TatE family subunit [Candidatus Didemnitutus sp.]|nr:twin-arginine translocase TatA/TatE family subunit [Candidatus Didemnitutus sp.]